MGAEFRNFARGLSAYVNRYPDDDQESAGEEECNKPGRNVSHAQGSIKRGETVHRHRSMQKDLGYPGHHDENENENIVPFQPASDRFEFADFK